MGEPNYKKSARIFPHSDDVCLSHPDEDNSEGDLLDDGFSSRPLEPNNTATNNNKLFASSLDATEPLNHSAPNPAPAFDGNGSSEICSSEALQKGIAATATPQATSSTESIKNTETDSAGSEVAVREDAEGNEKEEDNQSLCERQSPSPSPSLTVSVNSSTSMRTQQLRSSLKPKSALPASALRKGRHQRTKRRIRGIWGDDKSSQFSQLHDETILKIMKFFSMKELCIASMVCERFKHLALHRDSWKRIDATDFVEAAYRYYVRNGQDKTTEAPKSTSLALAARIERYTPISLSIHSIEQRLSPDNFLSSLPSLQELTLTSFSGLTDIQVHVLLLSSSCKNVQARSKRSSRMLKLALENCPLLTNATVQSIGNLCPQLEELSLKGNSKITDLSPLSELWMQSAKPVAAAATSSAAASSMFSLFGPPAPSPASTKSAMADLFQPPPTKPRPTSPSSTGTNSLQSLFALPGQSPPRTQKQVISILPRPLSKKNSNVKQPATLARVNVSNTGVTAKSLLAAWKAAVPPMKVVRLAHLVMNGKGETWNDASLREMANLLDLAKLETLEIGCSVPSSRTISDGGIQRLVEATTSQEKVPFSSLKRLNLARHQSLSGTCIANIISRAETALEELVLDGCTGLSARSSNAAKDFAHVDALSKAILKCTTRERNNKGESDTSNGGRGLRRLSLSGCFSNQSLLQKSNSKQMHEETIGSFLLESLGPPQKKKKKRDNPPTATTSTTVSTLVELDLTGCWFVTASDVAALRKRCPSLSTIYLEGTRAVAKS